MKTIARLTGGTAMLVLAATSAHAGGYQRGQADTDILYEPGGFASRFGYTYVNPERGFESINGVSGDYETYTGEYDIPSFAIKYGVDNFACAGTFTETFAAEADYSGLPGGAQPASAGNRFGSRTRTQEFDSQEFGATCRVSYELNRGRISVIGGAFWEDFSFTGSSLSFAPGPVVPTPFGPGQVLIPGQVDVEMDGDYKAGYRIGAAYEIPEIALRAQVLYRSEVEHDDISGTGIITALGGANQIVTPIGAIPAPGAPLPEGANLTPGGLPTTLNTATSPASLNINVQTGIAQGTLLIGSFRWTDWSTNEQAIVSLDGRQGSVTPFNWQDGYTASIGLGRAFTENVSGLVAFGYDRGVSTGAETTYTDLYTLSGGFSFRQGIGELRVGGLIGYWTDGEQSVSDGALFNATVGDDWVYAANASLKFAF